MQKSVISFKSGQGAHKFFLNFLKIYREKASNLALFFQNGKWKARTLKLVFFFSGYIILIFFFVKNPILLAFSIYLVLKYLSSVGVFHVF